MYEVLVKLTPMNKTARYYKWTFNIIKIAIFLFFEYWLISLQKIHQFLIIFSHVTWAWTSSDCLSSREDALSFVLFAFALSKSFINFYFFLTAIHNICCFKGIIVCIWRRHRWTRASHNRSSIGCPNTTRVIAALALRNHFFNFYFMIHRTSKCSCHTYLRIYQPTK